MSSAPLRATLGLIPAERIYTVKFYGIGPDSVVDVQAGGVSVPFQAAFDTRRNILSVTLDAHSVTERIEVLLRRNAALMENDLLGNAYELLNRAQVPFMTKENLYRLLEGKGGRAEKLSTIHSTYMDEGIRQAVTELLTAW